MNLQQTMDRIEERFIKMMSALDDLMTGSELDVFTFDGVNGVENQDGTIACSCGREYKTLDNWKKHVTSMHRGSI